MPRIARVVAAGYPHHITQRGNYQQEIFSDDRDREKYISLIENENKRYGLIILAYCLMSNHVYVIGVPKREDSMWNVFKYVNMKYSQYHNRRMGISGHLFQGRFFSCVMDEQHTMACARYIERNPVRAKIVKKPWNWKWSSAKVHCGLDRYDKLGVRNLFDYIDIDEGRDGWKGFIEEVDNAEEIKEIREQTRRGRPLGGSSFVERLEGKYNRSLKLKSRGRPRKKMKK